MKKMNTKPISGMQELLPATQAIFDNLKSRVAGAFRSHGFLAIETPAIERSEILLAKAGGETEKQIYKVFKTAETASDADQALRFDQTVSLARYVVEHENDLSFPFKVSQIGRSFRGERAQKGRFREFYQCDIDVIGRGSLPIEYDAEVMATLYTALASLECLPKFRMRISNRKLLTGLIEELNLQTVADEIFCTIDHAEKVPRKKTLARLEKLGIGSENVVKITTFTEIKGGKSEVLEKLRAFRFENATFQEGLAELEAVLGSLEERLPAGSVEADMVIVRGLDYYTGTVFETFVNDYPELGSICSGGRYENLASHYTDQVFPGVGGSIGLTRLFYVLQENGFLEPETLQTNGWTAKPVDVAIIPMDKVNYAVAEKWAEKLRAEGVELDAKGQRNGDTGKKSSEQYNGVAEEKTDEQHGDNAIMAESGSDANSGRQHIDNPAVDVLYSEKRLGDRLALAAKTAKFAIVVGDNEIRTGIGKLKNLDTGEQLEISI